MIREAYQQAAQFFIDTVAQIQDSQWEQHGLGEWTVRDLVGHTSRALLTVETYLVTPASTAELQQPVEYFVRAKASLADPAAVAARGREAGQALGAAPLATIRATAQRVLARVASAADTTLVKTPVGGMRLIDYLPTRVFELTIHTLDLASALAVTVTPPEAAGRVTSALVTDMALSTGQLGLLLRTATGRGTLPAGFSVL